MKRTTFLFLLLVSTVSCLPGKSPLCDSTDIIATKLLAHGPLQLGDPTAFNITISKTCYAPGDNMTVNVAGPEFRGLLMYLNPSNDKKRRAGTFVDIPRTFQSNLAVCAQSNYYLNEEFSVITHTFVRSPYLGNQTFKYKAPKSDAGDLNLNMVIIKFMSGRFVTYIYKDVVVLKGCI
ncbi:hypothetical protein HDU97_005742 [Phlyctochytrium planicorne]|nr:hypothetical protein HDU97_005742 [Phlyctochytrium planicorne]